MLTRSSFYLVIASYDIITDNYKNTICKNPPASADGLLLYKKLYILCGKTVLCPENLSASGGFGGALKDVIKKLVEIANVAGR
jgi:hypothetical protein